MNRGFQLRNINHKQSKLKFYTLKIYEILNILNIHIYDATERIINFNMHQ